MQRPNRQFRHRGGGRRKGRRNAGAPPSSQYGPPEYWPDYFYEYPDSYPQFHHQAYQFDPYFQNPNMQFQDRNRFQYQRASLNQISNNVASTSNVHDSQGVNLPTWQQRNTTSNVREPLEKIEAAAEQARRELIASGENVSTWKLIQSVLVKLKVESWDSLGFHLQQVPSLFHHIVVEGNINAFIHCFVAVRAICSLHDLQVAICENEGVEKFEELDLGPLIRHPLIEHYFSSNDMTEIYKITGEETISHLKMYIFKNKGKIVDSQNFLKFVADECEVHDWKKMGVRVKSLGIHIKHIRKALKQDNALIKIFLKKERDTSNSKRARKRPFFSLEKKQIDDRYSTIIQRVASFSSAYKDFRGKHKQFIPSSSDDDDDHDKGDYNEEDNIEQRIIDCNEQKELLISSENKRNDKASSCSYPSAAEDMIQLGMRGDNNGTSPATRMLRENDEPVKKKRKLERQSCSAKDKASMIGDPVFLNDSVRIFITTWKEACHQHTATEVLEIMLEIYCSTSPRQKKKLKTLLSSDPFVGLLNVAVLSIKNGSWDSIYEAFQSFDDLDCTNANSNKCIEYEQLDVERGDDLPSSNNHNSECGLRVTVEDINRKVAKYFENECPLFRDDKSPSETMIMLARKLLLCEVWLNQQFSVKNFDSLGYGEYLAYLEKNISQLPTELHGNLSSQVREQFPFEASLLKEQLVALLSQASDSLWEGGSMTKHKITELLSRQFPLITFSVTEKGYAGNSSHTTEHKSSNCILFSATLLGMSTSCDSVDNNGNRSLDFNSLGLETSKKVQNVSSFTPTEAVEALLGAPMLVDLSSWLHWDAVYAPSLGPLVTWLLTEVNTKDLLCLFTRDCKIIRIDPLASPKSFYKALLQGSSFQVAVELLSLFALNGGVKRLPSLLLKDHARQAFEALLTFQRDRGLVQGNSGGSCITSGTIICMKQDDVKEATSHTSRLVLDCLGYLPAEFQSVAADILLSGLQSVVKCAPSSVLHQCKSNEQRLMLHEVGFALGLVEWIDDHHKLCPIVSDQSCMPIPALPTVSLGSGLVDLGNQQELSTKMLLSQEAPTFGEVEPRDEKTDLSSSGFTVRDGIQNAVQLGEMKDANLIIESIRREEFGLGSDVESGMLKKQHARLGRALHCLSQELYSQDSHFLLELIQNADDNSYQEEVEPTLMFILQNNKITVLNNEKGFTAQNIRALCDVGNSTKKGSASGYIGQKGIGFKSVFRVTDAPEIHSNGFHIKFDITEGQIGFVLPTAVPPCNVDLIKHLGSAYPDQMDTNSWNTCMLLPFRSRLTQGLEISKIISMFSDIHPSLLLFLHRLQCIKLINMLDNSCFAMRREIVGDGLVKVSFGDHKMTWFIASKKLSSESIRPGVQATEISIALTLKESEDGKYEPHLEQQPVFAFLPLRMYGLKFILQGDFALPSSREEVDGDSSWNQWLLSEFPDLFVSAEKSFCSLSCFRENPGKAVTAYMHFVPLIGEVQGFFYGLPRMIISRLRQSDCLLEEGCDKVWVPPCNVLRSWDDHARVLLPDVLLRKHLQLGFLDKDIILPDSLARALGIQDYGPKILVQFLSSICCVENGLNSMGFRWLSLCLNEIHVMLNSPGKSTENSSFEMDLISSLRKVPFLPLSDGTYGSIIEGTIWLNVDSIKTGAESDTDSKIFPKLYASLKVVCPSLFSSLTAGASWVDDNFVNNIASLLHKIGVQHLTAHEIIRSHILPIISDDKLASKDHSLFIECNAFLMLHLQSTCPDCRVEKEHIISELQSKALLLTNQGFKRLSEVTIHFGKGFGNSIDVSRLISGIDYKWHEIDELYLKHPLTGSISAGLMRWREFFNNLGVTDFVKVTQTERNICDASHIIFQQVKWDRDLMSSGMLVTDCESQELDFIISSLASIGNLESSIYLLEVLDALWDDYFSDKTACYLSSNSIENNTSFKSSFMNNICDVCWVASSMGKELHYPRDLFDDCAAVRSILGNFAPYVTPKIRNNKLVADIGLKTHVTIDDIFASLQKWRTMTHFKASVSQMSRLYTFLSKELATSKKEIMEAFSSGPFIFVPCTTGVSQEDVVAGLLLSPEEVYWHDGSSALDSMKKHSSAPDFHVRKVLCDIYPGLHDFFVNDCGVNEALPFRCYLQILKQISNSALPLEAASAVFQVFLLWSDGIRCGAMVDDDISYLRDHLLTMEFTVLPALQDKWVSLHPSFGLVCWVDDDSLKKQFKHSDNIEFLHFGELTSDENQMLQTKVSVFLKKLGIPALSEVMTREAIYYGPSDSSFKSSLVTWALPFAQRYIYTVHAEKYNQLKLSGFEKLQGLRIVVVETLFYRNAIKHCGASSKKRSECSCLLQDAILYIRQESDTHSIFMELSRLFFDGVPELHLANFLHMLATMAESGSTEEQMEFFILNSQNMPKIPDDEPIWLLSSPQVSDETGQTLITPSNSVTTLTSSSNFKKKNLSSSWPPAGWKNAPGFERCYLRTDVLTSNQGWNEPDTTENRHVDVAPADIKEDYNIEDSVLPESLSFYNDINKSTMPILTSVVIESHCPEDGPSKPTDVTSPDAQQAAFTGRLGEFVAFRHLKAKHGDSLVKWMNEQKESGLPYDIAVGEKVNGREFIEVKASRYSSKNWFKVTTREWQFAVEKGDRYSIAHIALSTSDPAKITIYKNPVKLCQFGKLDLAVMMPMQQQL